MSLSNAFESDVLKLLLQNANIANLGDATGVRGSSTAGNLYMALHTADPGEAGDQTTSEATYGSYVRQAIPRTSSDWDVTGTAPTQGANHNQITFPAASSPTPPTVQTLTHFSLGFASSGASEIFVSGPLGAPIAVSTPVQPFFPAGTIVVTAD
jgi:hypothetical protein